MTDEIDWQQVAAFMEQQAGEAAGRHQAEMALMRTNLAKEIQARDRLIADLKAELKEQNVQKEDAADATGDDSEASPKA